MKLNLSALDIVPVYEGENARDAIYRSTQLAQALEDMNFKRFLVAEHHNLGGTASSSTSNIIQHILSKTNTIRVGAGGVMLPNHSPLQVAETYGTLDALYPGRVDLGIGRAPGTDRITSSLITRKSYISNQEFLNDIQMIEFFFGPLEQQEVIGAFPGADADVQIIILGSSTNSAYVAAELGLMYAFAAHINPQEAEQAINIYRQRFKPSQYLDEPYVMLGTWLFAANSEEKAEKLHNSTQRRFLKTLSGEKRTTPGLSGDSEKELTSAEKILLTRAMGMNIIGTKPVIKEQLKQTIDKYKPDEIIAVTNISEHEDLIDCYKIFAQAIEEL